MMEVKKSLFYESVPASAPRSVLEQSVIDKVGTGKVMVAFRETDGALLIATGPLVKDRKPNSHAAIYLDATSHAEFTGFNPLGGAFFDVDMRNEAVSLDDRSSYGPVPDELVDIVRDEILGATLGYKYVALKDEK